MMIKIEPAPAQLVGKAAELKKKGENLSRLDLAVKVAGVLHEHVRERAIQRADVGTPVAPYSSKRRKVRISRAYQRSLGLSGDKVVYRSSAEAHAALHMRVGQFLGSAGMWRSMRTRNVGLSQTTTEFTGSSQAQSVQWRKPIKEVAKLYQAEKTRIAALTSKGAKRNALNRLTNFFAKYMRDDARVTNNFKAWSVLESKKVNVLAPKLSELEACNDVVQDLAANLVLDAMIAALRAGRLAVSEVSQLAERPAGDPALWAKLRRAL